MSIRGGVGTRLFISGGQEVRSEFDRTGQHAQRMWSQIGAGERTANPALRLVSSAAEEARGAVEGMAASAGGLGRGLSLLGPAGIAAGAALGGLLMAIQNSRATAEWGAQLADTADKLGVTAEALQELRHAGEVFAVDAADVDRGIQNLNASLGAMRTGIGDGRVKAVFESLGISDAQLASLNTADELLPILADKISALGSRADQTQIAKRLQIEELLPLLVQGSAGLAEMTEQARDLGLVMDETTVQGLAAMDEQLRVADERLQAAARSMDTAMVPALVAMKEALADAAIAAADLFNWVNRNAISNVDRQIEQRLNVAAQARARAGVLRDENASALEAFGTGAVTGLQAGSMPARLAAAARQEAMAIRAETEIQSLSLREQARLKALSDAGAARIEGASSGGGSSGVGGGRASGARTGSGSSGISVASIDTQLPFDPITGQLIRPRSREEEDRERLFGPQVRDAVDLPVKVNLLPSLQENLAEYQRDFQDRTQSAFADGLRAAMDGNLGQFLAARLRESLIESLATGLSEGLAKAAGAAAAPGGGGFLSSALNFGASLFGRRAAGGDVGPGRAYSMAEYGGAELAVFGANGQVFDHTATERMLQTIAAPQAATSVTVNAPVSIDARGAGPREIEILRGELDQMRREQPARIVQVVNEGLQRRMIRG